jgi:hypothetical protein
MREGGPVKIWFAGWVDAEAKAHTLRIWQPLIVPGIVQTPSYARELFTATGVKNDQLGDYVESRLSRQAILDQPEPPSVVIVLDEPRRVSGCSWRSNRRALSPVRCGSSAIPDKSKSMKAADHRAPWLTAWLSSS